MVYAIGLAEALPGIDATSDCGHCGNGIVWDEMLGWLHVDGFYACRHPATGLPREVMASPHRERR